jgi:NAD(P)-dependent dehydrogenase (short-subunit alcohol dehydrogenase family)
MAVANPFSLTGKRILVTGASSGIGRQIAVSCAHMGATIIGVGRDEVRIRETQQVLDRVGRGHQMVSAELTEPAGRDALVAALGGLPLQGVAHVCGISRLVPVRMFSEKHMREVQATNVEAPMLLTQALLKRALLADGGSILFMASIAAHIGVPGVGMYSGTKAALIAIMRSLSMEVAKRRIRANCLSPALVRTPLLDATAKIVGSMDMEENNYPLGFGTPEDVANAAIYFLSDASRWVTGTTLVMDGGLTVQ